MKDLWNRLSAKGKETVIKSTLYVVWIVVFWFLGKKVENMTPATAFFGLAALTGVFTALYWFVKTKILGIGKTAS